MADAIIKESVWYSKDNETLINPKLPVVQQEVLLSSIKKHLPKDLERHICLLTSGSSGKIKWVVIGKEAFLIAAEAANYHLSSNMYDTWLNPLPGFHVGGLAIYARAWLSGAKVVTTYNSETKWSPEIFLKGLISSKATLTSLVPAQIYDLVSGGLKAPKKLRAVIVGGGALLPELYQKARELGWPLLPSYGMSEAGSQIATAPISSLERHDFPQLKPLRHVRLKLNDQGLLMIKGRGLLTGYMIDESYFDPKNEGWFTTEDRVALENGMVIACSRDTSFIKIGGESVDLNRLNALFDRSLQRAGARFDASLVPVADVRLGQVVHLAVGGSYDKNSLDKILEEYQTNVAPYEKIRKIHYLEAIPRTALGKVLLHELKLEI